MSDSEYGSEETNLTKILLTQIGTVLNSISDVPAYPEQAPSIAGYPHMVYWMFASSTSNTQAFSFDCKTETFMVQVSCYSKGDGWGDLIDLQAEIEDAMKNKVLWGSSYVQVKYLGGQGPVPSDTQGYWQCDKTFMVTLGV